MDARQYTTTERPVAGPDLGREGKKESTLVEEGWGKTVSLMNLEGSAARTQRTRERI